MFDFSKLKGRIREICQSETNFAKEMDINRSTLSSRLNNKSDFSATEITKACQVLKISTDEVGEYFFKDQVSL